MKNKCVQKYIEAPYPHFRKYKKSRHPALLVGEDRKNRNVVIFHRTSHESSVARKKGFFVISPNPKPGDSRPMYVEKKKRADEKKFFSPRPYTWKIKNKKG